MDANFPPSVWPRRLQWCALVFVVHSCWKVHSLWIPSIHLAVTRVSIPFEISPAANVATNNQGRLAMIPDTDTSLRTRGEGHSTNSSTNVECHGFASTGSGRGQLAGNGQDWGSNAAATSAAAHSALFLVTIFCYCSFSGKLCSPQATQYYNKWGGTTSKCSKIFHGKSLLPSNMYAVTK